MAKTLHIKNPDNLARVLDIFSALDDIRWSHATNYNLINHCADDFTPDEKLLSHWLCYVTDRQTAFERVWEVGGYVLSHLVRAFTRDGKSPEQVMLDHLQTRPDGSGLRLVCPLCGPSKRLAHYDIHEGPVEFASRYMPSDSVSIYRTFVILDAVADRSFSRYMCMAVSGQTDQAAAVRRLAVALHFLTYADVGQVAAKHVRDRIAALPGDIYPRIESLKEAPAAFLATLEMDFGPHNMKRLWCSIRDYLKSPEFNPYFVQALQSTNTVEARRWAKGTPDLKRALAAMELPGDVWNNIVPVSPLPPIANRRQVEPGALIVGGVEPEHTAEDGGGFLEALQAPETEAVAVPPSRCALRRIRVAAEIRAVADEAPGAYGREIRAEREIADLHADLVMADGHVGPMREFLVAQMGMGVEAA